MAAFVRVSGEGQKSQVIGAPELTRKLIELRDKVMPQATASATNRVAKTVQSRAVKEISKATGYKQGSVRRRVVMRKRASAQDPTAIIQITGKPLNLVESVSGARVPRSPRIGVTAKAWGKTRKYRGVFLAQMPNGQVIAVKRSSAGKTRSKLISKGRWAGKSPHIEAVWGPGIAMEAARSVLRITRENVVRERMHIEIERELRFRVQKLLTK